MFFSLHQQFLKIKQETQNISRHFLLLPQFKREEARQSSLIETMTFGV